MMARSSGDHGDQDHRPSEEGKTSDGSLAVSRSASADPMRQSLDSHAQTHKPSVSTASTLSTPHGIVLLTSSLCFNLDVDIAEGRDRRNQQVFGSHARSNS